MSEVLEASSMKTGGEKTAGSDEKGNGNFSAKRSREDCLEFSDIGSPKKMRKKSLQTTGGIKSEDTAKSEAVSDNNVKSSKENDYEYEDFDFGEDNAFLDDLLGDFSHEAPASIDRAVPAKQNGTSRGDSAKKHTESKCQTETKTSSSANELLDAEIDGDFDNFFEETFVEDTDKIGESTVDFQEFRCCRIVEINHERQFTRLKVEGIRDKQTASVLCYGFWREAKVETDDIVSIKAAKKEGKWTIDNQCGFLVTQPHTLISGTSVVGGHFCLRRGVLTEFFRGLDDLPSTEPGESAMTVGTLVHEVLQKVLRKKITSMVDIKRVAEEILKSRRSIQMIYESHLSEKECKQRMEPYLSKIYDFVKRYVIGTSSQIKDDNFSGKIESIRDIEENVWVPQLGLKGKIDVTVDVKVNVIRKTMPLEVKTGQPSFSAEHRGQLMLYNMMLGFLGHQVDAGLLLYIRDNIVKEVKNNHHEERDLIMLRNSFAYYVSKLPESEEILKEDGNVEKTWKRMELPEPINHRMACGKCPYNILCSVYAEKDPDLQLSESHVLKAVKKSYADLLTSEHIDYVLNWITMLKLEESSRDGTTLKALWTTDPEKREKRGACVSNLKVHGKIEDDGNKFLTTFVRKNSEISSDLCSNTFSDSEYIIVSTDTRINVSSGYIKIQSKDKIQMLLDRDIVKQNPSATFHLDKYPFGGLTKMALSNIACLLNIHDITNKLRGIIIDKNPTTFIEKLPRSVAELGAPILYSLNKYQRQAILKVLSTKDYLLIRGMPGTGKTQTLIALIELLVKMGNSVLITAHTHSAVDNILLKLDEKGIDFLRLGSGKRIHPKLLHKSEDVLTVDCESVGKLETVYNSKNVVGVTCCGAVHALLSRKIFDICLVDESTQVQQATVIKPLFSAKKFVLVGDPEQLPPVVRNRDARKMGMDESLFRRLQTEDNTVSLKLQYRMNRKIMSIANEMTYGGAMKAGTSEVASATLNLTDTMVLESCERWISRALSLELEDSVVMLNTGQTCVLKKKFDLGEKEEDKKRIHNVLEATVIMRLIAVLLKGGINAKFIGVISPYVAQVELLRSLCQEDVEINTVDQYQGRDKDVILYSCTRSEPTNSDPPAEFEVLQDRQRLNVAVTRAKHKFILVGDKLTLDRYAPLKKLFSIIQADIVNLEDGRDDFSWESLVRLIK